MQANMHEAKSKLSQLVESALMGEEVIIAKAGKPAVRLVPCKPSKERISGKFKGKITLADDFDANDIADEISEEFGI